MFQASSAEINGWVVQFVWPFFRVLALFTTAPLLGHRAFPRRVRLALALVIAVLITPNIAPAPASSLTSAYALVYLLQQFLVGVAIGFSMLLVFAAIETAGEFIGLNMGLSFATFIDPMNNRPTPIVGSYLGVMASLTFLALDGHLLLIAALHESFQIVPLALPADGKLNPMQVIDLVALLKAAGDIFRIGLQISLPVMAAILITNIAMGLLARTAPQLNIFAVGFPITLLVGFGCLLLALPYLRVIFEHILSHHFLHLLRSTSGG
ncbi:flagellar biosynthetic protein FliR [Parvibium lacunae]|uniref:Flagellar biosynthetic protein FliR n=1 Tax=Parvibium lacunae TaxID=1888893 RepID=A0A368L436_9BURK|nr:flagellar biosynthetic protein FliR [Parvibium lacunae]RCS58327.1 flagellar biosynthetic protein FliR [Parvibium lacunae]